MFKFILNIIVIIYYHKIFLTLFMTFLRLIQSKYLRQYCVSIFYIYFSLNIYYFYKST